MVVHLHSMVAKKVLSLVFVRDASKILLGLKKRGFGQGWWNGFGGKVEPGETIKEGALRELKEEAGIVGHDLLEVGLINFEFEGDPVLLEVHIFSTNKYTGQPTESEDCRAFLSTPADLIKHQISSSAEDDRVIPPKYSKMKPKWFDIDDIPFSQMWADDSLWFPLLLKGSKFNGYFLFKGHHEILKYTLDEVKELKY